MWVGRIATSIMVGIALALGCVQKGRLVEEVGTGPLATIAKPLEKLPDEPMLGTLIKGDLIMAATQTGLFRGSISKKQWEQISFPTNPNAALIFGDDPSSNLFAVILPRKGWDEKNKRVVEVKGPGLYLSRDQGKTWLLRSNDHEFEQVLQLGKKLFAVVRRDPSRASYDNGVVIVSDDEGKTWRDLTTPVSRAFRILPDPDHPGLICMQVTGIRMYLYQADDENYKWKQYKRWNLPIKPKPYVPPKVTGCYVELGHFPIFRATIKNYFANDFGDGLGLPGLIPSPGKSLYSFGPKGPRRIQIQVTLTAQKDNIELLDNKKNHDFWWLEVRGPSGQIIRSTKFEGPLGEKHKRREERVLAAKEYRQSNPVSIVKMKTGSVYNRSLDLNNFAKLSEPGTYWIRVYYNSGWALTTTHWNIKTDYEFCGGVGSEEFQVQITE